MSEMKLSYEEFADQWREANPLPEKFGAVQWADSACRCIEAYRAYDPDGYTRAIAKERSAALK